MSASNPQNFTPTTRASLTDRETIIARMAADMAARIRLHGRLDLSDLIALGWSQAQVNDHWNEAWNRPARVEATRGMVPPLRRTSPGDTTLGREILDSSACIAALAIILGVIFIVAGA